MSDPTTLTLQPGRDVTPVTILVGQGDATRTFPEHLVSSPQIVDEQSHVLPCIRTVVPDPTTGAHGDIIASTLGLSTTHTVTDNAPVFIEDSENMDDFAQLVDFQFQPVAPNLDSGSSLAIEQLSIACPAASTVPSRGVLVDGASDNIAVVNPSNASAVLLAATVVAGGSINEIVIPVEQALTAGLADEVLPGHMAHPSFDAAAVAHSPASYASVTIHDGVEPVDVGALTVYTAAVPTVEDFLRHVGVSVAESSRIVNAPAREVDVSGHHNASHAVAYCAATAVHVASSLSGTVLQSSPTDSAPIVARAVEDAAPSYHAATDTVSPFNDPGHDLPSNNWPNFVAGIVPTSVIASSDTLPYLSSPTGTQPIVRVEPWQGYMIFDAFPYDDGGYPQAPFDQVELPTDLACFH